MCMSIVNSSIVETRRQIRRRTGPNPHTETTVVVNTARRSHRGSPDVAEVFELLFEVVVYLAGLRCHQIGVC